MSIEMVTRCISSSTVRGGTGDDRPDRCGRCNPSGMNLVWRTGRSVPVGDYQ